MIELVMIGVELLEGSTVDTNSAYIGQRLLEQGYEVARKTTVPDDVNVLKTTLKQALDRSSIVITTGGLGPTLDDLTLNVAVSLFDTELEHSQVVEDDLKKRFGPDLPSLKNQARVPKGAKFFLNEVGTAPCVAFSKQGKHLIIMPGVPTEMRYFMKNHVVDFLNEIIEQEEKIFHKTAYLFRLTESEVDPFLRNLQAKYPEVETGIYPSYGTLGLALRMRHKEEALAREAIAKVFQEISNKFSTLIYSEEERAIEMALHNEMRSFKKTLALAESCTGGMIAARICQIPKASDFFVGGIVSYSNAIKEKFLHVASLEKCGAVSEEVAREMAEGALKECNADFAIAVSGVAGPDGGTPDKPVGTVWCAIAERDKQTFSGKLARKGRKSRETIIEYTGTYVMGSLWRYLRYGEEPFKELL